MKHREWGNSKQEKSKINQMQIKQLAALDKQKTEITQRISFITQRIVNLKKVLTSTDLYFVSAYKSWNNSFRK